MKSLVVVLLLAFGTTVSATGSGDHLARPMSVSQVQVTATWTWLQGQAVYAVQVTNPDGHAVTHAAEAVMRHVQPQFQGFSWAQQTRLGLYVVAQHTQGSTQVIYIKRNIETDWLIGG
jgi:hypothetical protein